jgi:hypothetical protein
MYIYIYIYIISFQLMHPNALLSTNQIMYVYIYVFYVHPDKS